VVEARELRDIRLGEWRTRFAKARAGVTLSAEDIAEEVERWYDGAWYDVTRQITQADESKSISARRSRA
jgi:hypothetical protein